jgi:peptidoglycan/xylan/chitin deacetylase (PgdA/CDA1 family)
MVFGSVRHWRGPVADLVKRLTGAVGVGLHRLLGSRAGRRVGILVYHRVAPRYPGVPEPTLNVTPRSFREQLHGLSRRGFQFRPLRAVLDAHRKGLPVPPRTVVVTFDDGYANVCTEAWPVLHDLRIPTTVFLNTAYLGQEAPFPFDAWGQAHRHRLPPDAYRPLTPGQCRTMAADGLVELAAHTHTHRDLRGRPEEFGLDLGTCVRQLQDLFGLGDVTFAFPFGRRHLGYVSDELTEAARRTGVLCALTTEAFLVDPRTDPFAWGRFNAYDWDTGSTLAAKLSGWYGWAPRIQEHLSRLARPSLDRRADGADRSRPGPHHREVAPRP